MGCPAGGLLGPGGPGPLGPPGPPGPPDPPGPPGPAGFGFGRFRLGFGGFRGFKFPRLGGGALTLKFAAGPPGGLSAVLFLPLPYLMPPIYIESWDSSHSIWGSILTHSSPKGIIINWSPGIRCI